MGHGFGEDSFIRGIPLRCAGGPEDVASIVAFLIGDAAASITEQTLLVDGGQSLL